jgi:hypothetical protein
VIQDPLPWTEELADAISRCEQAWREHPGASTDWLTLQAEKAVFLTAFVARKLMDSGRVPAGICGRSVEVGLVEPHSAVGVHIGYVSWRELDSIYDFDTGATRRLSMRQLFDQLIHSYVFLVVGAYDSSVDDPYGLYFNSDRSRDHELLYLGWETYKQLIGAVEQATIPRDGT